MTPTQPPLPPGGLFGAGGAGGLGGLLSDPGKALIDSCDLGVAFASQLFFDLL